MKREVIALVCAGYYPAEGIILCRRSILSYLKFFGIGFLCFSFLVVVTRQAFPIVSLTLCVHYVLVYQ